MKLGFLVSNMGGCEIAHHILKQAHDHLGYIRDLDIIAFYENVAKPQTTPLFALLNLSEAFGFDGTVIATNLDTAEKMRGFPGPKYKFFYMWDPEWIECGGKSYEQMARVYCDDNLPIIARSDSHARLIERCWNRPVLSIVPQCDIPKLLKVIDRESQR